MMGKAMDNRSAIKKAIKIKGITPKFKFLYSKLVPFKNAELMPTVKAGCTKRNITKCRYLIPHSYYIACLILDELNPYVKAGVDQT
jgi:hypothetical protein